MEKSVDIVNHPPHYSWLKAVCGVEVIDITRHMDFNLGNAIKYILRAGHKRDAILTDSQKEIEDLKKAIWYIDDKIKHLEVKKPRFCCAECGGTNIQVQAWVDANTNAYIDDVSDGRCWCEDCGRHTAVEEVKEKNDETD